MNKDDYDVVRQNYINKKRAMIEHLENKKIN